MGNIKASLKFTIIVLLLIIGIVGSPFVHIQDIAINPFFSGGCMGLAALLGPWWLAKYLFEK